MCLQNLKPQPHHVNFWGYVYSIREGSRRYCVAIVPINVSERERGSASPPIHFCVSGAPAMFTLMCPLRGEMWNPGQSRTWCSLVCFDKVFQLSCLLLPTNLMTVPSESSLAWGTRLHWRPRRIGKASHYCYTEQPKYLNRPQTSGQSEHTMARKGEASP